MMTIGDARVQMKTCEPSAVRLMLSQVTGLTKSELTIHHDRVLSPDEIERLFKMMHRVQQGEPLQYVLGAWDFMGFTFRCDARALIPRPETELLVEQAILYAQQFNKKINILDLCTGTGCIAISMALLLGAKAYEVTAVDISDDALSLAYENANKLNAKINFIKADVMQALPFKDASFDIVVSNPPYIPSEDVHQLDDVVKNHEPHLALDGGADGINPYRVIIPQAHRVLKHDGGLFLEIGPDGVFDLMTQSSWAQCTMIKDYNGLNRIVCGYKT